MSVSLRQFSIQLMITVALVLLAILAVAVIGTHSGSSHGVLLGAGGHIGKGGGVLWH